MAYKDYLASRGYQRAVVQRTEKRDGDAVLHDVCKPVEIIKTGERKVVEMKRKAAK